jgi:hypothetical protein
MDANKEQKLKAFLAQIVSSDLHCFIRSFYFLSSTDRAQSSRVSATDCDCSAIYGKH